VTTEEYFADRPGASPRPLNSTLDLAKIEATGFEPRKAFEELAEYFDR
jgi:dTDP-4-dehydrorhamnose 3,5-epimerase